MKTERVNYQFKRYKGKVLGARREISYEIQLSSRLLLDELCYKWNKKHIQAQLDQAIDNDDRHAFLTWSKVFSAYIRE
ncbi:hypothetical protein DX933_00325 [Ornithinibacillus gellani]|uniref:hypothetical protein n=1 Tax=Ornithinibacillus gellani TaxID=2293253 RepID=UPI000F46A41E|nr:hypothetical protein [Ornithinibacillus gellani]TQS76585.1 hypothetical protein DX933_00325 [Ornithinibacillus gellani]